MTDLDQLVEIEKLRGLNSRRMLAAIQAREADLRKQLGVVKSFRTELHSPDPTLTQMRAIGSDVLWSKWLDRTQTSLNMSLARVMSEKETVLRKARKDIGRSESISAMRDMRQQQQKKAAAKSQFERAIAVSLLGHAFKSDG